MANKSKKKILYVITKSVWGGAGKYVYDLATNLPKDKFSAQGGPASGWEVFVAAGPADGGASGKDELAQKLIGAGIPYFEIKNFQKNISFIKEIFSYFEVLLLLLKIRPDVIHVNSSKAGGIVGQASLDYRFLSFNFKLKTVFTAHGWPFHESRPKWQVFLIKLFTTVTCFYYSKIICVSEYDYQSAISNHIAPKRKLLTIHNGIDYDEYKFLSAEKARQKLNIPIDTLCIGTIGEFTKNKGQEYLIDAVSKLITNGHLLKTVLIGWGENKSNLKSQISNLKLENDVFLIDNLPDASSYLKAFDIFVLPSLKEGLPYTLLEAGLAELPVISTQVGGIPEIIGHDEGFLVEPADSDALADKIKELMENPEKRKLMGITLWHKILREFSLEKMLRATTAAYE